MFSLSFELCFVNSNKKKMYLKIQNVFKAEGKNDFEYTIYSK